MAEGWAWPAAGCGSTITRSACPATSVAGSSNTIECPSKWALSDGIIVILPRGRSNIHYLSHLDTSVVAHGALNSKCRTKKVFILHPLSRFNGLERSSMSVNVDVQVVAVIMVIRHFADHAITVVAFGDEHPVVPAFPRAVPFVFPRIPRFTLEERA